jgi:hypothetical protein
MSAPAAPAFQLLKFASPAAAAPTVSQLSPSFSPTEQEAWDDAKARLEDLVARNSFAAALVVEMLDTM